jgi:hypothetical protein
VTIPTAALDDVKTCLLPLLGRPLRLHITIITIIIIIFFIVIIIIFIIFIIMIYVN